MAAEVQLRSSKCAGIVLPQGNSEGNASAEPITASSAPERLPRTSPSTRPWWSYFFFHLASLPGLLLMMVATELPLIALVAIFTFFSLGMQPIENSLFAAYPADRWRSTGYGAKFVLTFGVGSVAVWLVTEVQRGFGLSSVFAALAVVLIVLLGAIGVLTAVSAGGKEVKPFAPSPRRREGPS